MHKKKEKPNIIIVDLEATTGYGTREIIEIGAVKLSKPYKGNYKAMSTFHTLVSPTKLKKIDHRTTDLTGLTRDEVMEAPSFNVAIHRFIKWLGTYEYYFCTWSPDDIYLLRDNCRLHNMYLGFAKNYNDLQRIFGEKWAFLENRQIGLLDALHMAGISFEGEWHNALSDALNTSRLFLEIMSEYDLAKGNKPPEKRKKRTT